jgi:hypothetical protein
MKTTKAEDILESDLWKTSLANVKSRILGHLEACDPSDTETLRSIVYKLWALNTITGELERELNLPSINRKT